MKTLSLVSIKVKSMTSPVRKESGRPGGITISNSRILKNVTMKHSRPLVLKGYGGWLKIENLPLNYWCRSMFEVIEDHFGDLIDIATETWNLTNSSEARIQVKKNLCGFVQKLQT